jgi:predicted nucleotide-binding protein (sugar kinase/HSP70/actin superfamily)
MELQKNYSSMKNGSFLKVKKSQKDIVLNFSEKPTNFVPDFCPGSNEEK